MRDAEAFRDEQQVPDRVEVRDSALDLGGGHSLALDGGEPVTQLGHALLWLAHSSNSGQALGGHVVAARQAVFVVPSWPRSRRSISGQM
jgi:hypothetical protein